MAQDIVPELNKAIETSFQSRMSRDSRVRAITKRMDAGTATLADMHDYSVRVGENLSGALRSNLTADVLPNETLYYNIADRTVRPALQTGYDLINDAAAATQKAIDLSNGIGINTVRAPFPDGRVDGLIDQMTHEITLEDALEWLAEPIINNAEAFFDDFVRENAKASAQTGLKCTIRRETSANACEWCAELGGTYEYGDEPKDVYRRHAFCRCQVTFSREKGKFQDVWSKRWYNTDGSALDRRREASESRLFQGAHFKAPLLPDQESWLNSIGALGTIEDITDADRSYVAKNIHQVSTKRNIGKTVTLSSMDYSYAVELKDYMDYNIKWKIPNDDNLNDAVARIKSRRQK